MAHVKSMQINTVFSEVDRIKLVPNPQGDHAKPLEHSEFDLIVDLLCYLILLTYCD